ncbi:hypothetical protein CONLIGDRAFT_696651 [Coniochaeta ligniaria NRRL 30616]|uniref:Uncharacterized protein n=1 Tax=Coniochaeta ligniaria NRRL 30616 TaxID=1408157 RepID=A0A1J7JV63_9PEZI|nr:hypothetical protein CONLIGDRAFT_696651 [Coniochaeta ligniaria NRRL 30616]
MSIIVPATGIVRKFYDEAIDNQIEYPSSAFWQIWLQRAFFELDTYGIVCEYSADGSRKRTNAIVRRYDAHHDTLSSLTWHEAKRPGVNPKEVEKQSPRHDLQLVPFSSGDILVDQYIHADSDDAWIMYDFVGYVKEQVPLGDAPTLPSQAHLLPVGGDFGESSMQGQNDEQTEAQYDDGQMEEAQYDDDAECSAQMAEGSAAMAERPEPTWSKIRLERIRHLAKRDGYLFTTINGHRKSTDKGDWTEITVKGKRAWHYSYKGTNYYTRDQPGS